MCPAVGVPTELPGMSQALTEYLARYRRTYVQTKVRLLLAMLGGVSPGTRVLDYGAGGGFMSLLCAKRGARVVVVEADEGELTAARELLKLHGLERNCEFFLSTSLPADLHSSVFDIIIAKDLLEHVEEDLPLVRSFAASQLAGGRLLVSTQNSRSLNYLLEGVYYNRWRLGRKDWCGWDDTHIRFYTPRSLQRLLQDAGYAVRKWGGNFIVPYGIVQWLTFGRIRVLFPSFSRFDLALGRVYPFCMLGWNLLALAERKT